MNRRVANGSLRVSTPHQEAPPPRKNGMAAPWRGSPPEAANEERFRHIVDENPTITWTADAEGRITYVNRRLAEYTGASAPVDVDTWAKRFLHPEDLPRRQAAWDKARAECTAYETELRIRRHDGVYRWFLARATPVCDAAGRPVEWLGSAVDIDERKRSEDNLRFLADASVALSQVDDVETTLRRIAALAVPFFCDWCEVTVREPGGAMRRVTVNHWDPEKVKHAEELERRYPRNETSGAMRVLRTGEPVFTPDILDSMLVQAARSPEHLEMMRALGLKSYISVPMRAGGNILGVLTFATAESRRVYTAFDLQVAEELARRAATALENAELVQALKEADRRKDEFLAVLAHELRNPLAPVRNAVEILRATHAPSPQLQWTHDVIDRQVRQMTRLVDDLLDVSRITRGKIELRKERVDLSVPIRLALESSRPFVERGGHQLTVKMAGEPLPIEGDVARLAQVVSNLLNNAAKFTPPGGHIRLTCERRGDEIVVRVIDTGVGIPAGMQARIFDMFTQAGSAADRSLGGLGIGLTLVKRLVEMHGGSVEARSEGANKGSEFVVRLPAAAEPAPARPPRSKLPAGGQLAPRRILVVDDNRDAADSLCMLLRAQGHEVSVAYDGLEAVDSAIGRTPDVVLMDIGLPGLYGYDAARRIREARGREVLLVAITGWGQDEDRRRSREAGFDFHLTKPVDPEAITRLLATQRPN